MAQTTSSGPRVTTVQRKYGSRLRGEYREINTAIREGVGDRDVFALQADALAKPPPSFEFKTTDSKVAGFLRWLNRQQQRGVLSVISRGSNTYVKSAYSAGIRWAHGRLRDENITTEVGVEGVFDMPVHRSTLQLLFTRNYEALDGITNAVSKDVSRTLTGGFAQGHGPAKMARELTDRVDKIGMTRATTLARTESIHASTESTKQRYRDMGVEEVDIINHAPCEEICKPIVEGGPYPIDDIPHGGPPFHPNCEGALLPVV